MSKKSFLTMLLALVSVALLAGCGQGDTAAATEAGPDRVVIYSNSMPDGQFEWIAERALEALNIEIYLVPGGAVTVANRIIAELGNPQGDIVFGMNQLLWHDLHTAGALSPFVPDWAGTIPAHLNHPDGYFHGITLIGNLLTFDTAYVDPANTPTDWLDLWNNPEFHGRYTVLNGMGTGTTQAIMAGIFQRFLDPNGVHHISAEGWENIAAKFRYAVVTDMDIYAELANPSSDAVIGQMWHHGIAPREEQFDIVAGWAVPEIGVPYSLEGIAIMHGASNPEAAGRFINWFGSPEVLQVFAYEFGRITANPDLIAGLDDRTRAFAAIPEQHIDWAIISAYMNTWIEHVYLNYLIR